MQKSGTAIILSGPSGVGKSTLVAAVRKAMPELEFSVSCTTRPPRTGEVDHVHYHFISDEEFVRHVEAGDFLEYAGVFARRYGTLKSEVLDRVARGVDVLLDIDVQGAMQIRQATERDPVLKAVCEFVFIGPPSVEVLETRLRGRATDSEEAIRERMAKAGWELDFAAGKFDRNLVNDKLEDTFAEAETLVNDFLCG